MTSCRLKLATFYFQIGKVRQCIQTVQAVLGRYRMEDTLPYCFDNHRLLPDRRSELAHCVLKLEPLFDDFTSFLSHISFPVIFSPWEICCAPVAIQNLISTRQLSTPRDHTFSDLLYIDGLVYAHYLLHIAYLDIGLHATARRNLTDLRRVVRDPWTYTLYYPEIARQLLAYCEAGSELENMISLNLGYAFMEVRKDYALDNNSYLHTTSGAEPAFTHLRNLNDLDRALISNWRFSR